MNKAMLIGRLTNDPDIRYTQGEDGQCIARFTLAVDRRSKRDSEQSADFIRCVAFGKLAEHVKKYYTKGLKVYTVGRIQTGSYERDSHRIYTTDVIAEELGFVESKAKTENTAAPQQGVTDSDGFMQIPDGVDEELPFV